MSKKKPKVVEVIIKEPTEREILIEKIMKESLYVRRGQFFFDYLKTASMDKLKRSLEKIEQEIADRGSRIRGYAYNDMINIRSGVEHQSMREYLDYQERQCQQT